MGWADPRIAGLLTVVSLIGVFVIYAYARANPGMLEGIPPEETVLIITVILGISGVVATVAVGSSSIKRHVTMLEQRDARRRRHLREGLVEYYTQALDAFRDDRKNGLAGGAGHDAARLSAYYLLSAFKSVSVNSIIELDPRLALTYSYTIERYLNTINDRRSDIGLDIQLDEMIESLQMIVDDLESPIDSVHAR